MLLSARSSNISALALAALIVFCARAQTIGTRPDDYVARAKQLIRTVYPGLNGDLKPVITDETRWGDGDLMNFFVIEFFDLAPKDSAGPPACWCLDPALIVAFIFDWRTENKELIIMSAGGRVAEGRADKFVDEMKRHPEWSDAEVIAALNAAGAKFGPDHKAEFLRALRLEELKPFIGGELQVLSAEPYLWDPEMEGKRSRGDLSWVVQAKWHGPDGWEAGATLAFEPFEGVLQSYRRDSLPRKTGGNSGVGAAEGKVPQGTEAGPTPDK